MRKAILLAMMVGFFASAARAEVYVGGSVGETLLKADQSGLEFKADDFNWKLIAGFRLIRFFGVEASYVGLGSPKDTQGITHLKAKISGTDVFAVGILPVGSAFDLFAKYGWMSTTLETEISGASPASSSNTKNNVAFGAGAGLRLGHHIGLRLEWERYNVSGVKSLDSVSAGALYRF
jgi:hypothetical protein